MVVLDDVSHFATLFQQGESSLTHFDGCILQRTISAAHLIDQQKRSHSAKWFGTSPEPEALARRLLWFHPLISTPEQIVMTKLEQQHLAVQVPFKSRYENYIGGKWVKPTAGRYFENITPITGKPVLRDPAFRQG
jgi:hypothetical protein